MKSKGYRNPKTMKRKLVNLQIFHGKIKGLNYPKNAEAIMEFGAGKLNDLQNWAVAGIKRVYAIEIDPISIAKGKDKYNKLRNRMQLPKVITKVADISTDYKEIMEDFKAVKHSIDHIICNFSIHYFLRNRKAIQSLMKLIKYFLKIDGTFRFTTLDGKKIYDLFQIQCSENKSLVLKKGNITYFRVERLFDCMEKFLDYGQTINVYVLSIGRKHREFLVNITYLTEVLRKNGLILDKITPFKKYSKGKLKKVASRLNNVERTYSYWNVFCRYTRRS